MMPKEIYPVEIMPRRQRKAAARPKRKTVKRSVDTPDSAKIVEATNNDRRAS